MLVKSDAIGGLIECKRLVKCNANEWSVPMQSDGQVECNFAIWLATEPMDMRAGTETALARVVAVFGAAKPHCAYLFANRRATRMKVLVHDGIGVWLAARRLNQGKFHWPGVRQGSEVQLDAEQLQALVLGLPWQRVGSGGAITLL
ncbi:MULTISPECIES: IS66 family insertion sequence element accessory protein TnpB [unclassified Pseudomonas]|uniref:IS66 family insertion sequence element accessory protein TnpB n=1 Tax=unclassified Pseudomonas TaxID=196821 RepID=UPI0013E9FD06|nr:MULTISPECIES: IS66 family insertion sequence element accessory protein TnpB [unclassified Pseudomonas]